MPWIPKGMPAVIIMISPFFANFSSRTISSETENILSVESISGVTNAFTPQYRQHRRLTSLRGVKAIIGINERCFEIANGENPLEVNVIIAFACSIVAKLHTA